MITIILLILGAVALAMYIPEKIRGYTVKATIMKSVVSVFFIAVAISAGSLAPLAQFIIMGLVFGLMGDIWLDLKYVYPAQDDPYTYAGFLSFAIGHILYIIGLVQHFYPGGKPLWILLPILLAVLVSAGNLMLEKTMKLHFGKMKWIVFGYGAILFSTVAISGSLALYHGWKVPTLNLFFAGGILFALSDLVLSGTYFGGKERPVDIILNYLTYYPAQFLIALSLLFLK